MKVTYNIISHVIMDVDFAVDDTEQQNFTIGWPLKIIGYRNYQSPALLNQKPINFYG